jgi:NAD(P)-dependent dehydrogenase (short-subunit alcohol dehydrogenase family)
MKKAILITGASSGIGEACALALASQGFHVFAGVRGAHTFAHAEITPLKIDITDVMSLQRAAVDIASSSYELIGLINNAGIVAAGPLEFLPLTEIRRQLEVNVIGTLAATQIFLPLLRQSRGRILNMSSISGRIALPFLGPYAASKFALEAISDSLRRELRPWKIAVVLIEPGAIRTPIWAKSIAAATDLLAQMPMQTELLYGEQMTRMLERVGSAAATGLDPQRVVEVMIKALTCRHPRPRYLVTRPWDLRVAMIRFLPDAVVDRLLARL